MPRNIREGYVPRTRGTSNINWEKALKEYPKGFELVRGEDYTVSTSTIVSQANKYFEGDANVKVSTADNGEVVIVSVIK